MEHLQPTSWAEALALRAERPDARPVAGGTDVMVELNFGRTRPPALLDLSRVPQLTGWERGDGVIRLGAAEPYSRIVSALSGPLPGLAAASRTVGSPQIRNRGSVGGNLGSASPAGDAHPPLLACGASVEVASVRGSRLIPVEDFFTGVKRNALDPDELIGAVHVPVARGPQQFAKIGTRNAMVIAVCSFGVAIDLEEETVGTGVGSAAPTPRRAGAAERFITGELAAAGLWHTRAPLPESLARKFGALVASAAVPIDDVRGTAAYRTHALAVIARRTLTWAWNDLRKETRGCGCHAM
ncbi:FAD binding domain-containing protein [Actinomadura barringtoniae]|uniref:FAD binding domain-containing protein n=1 Tax=Actinomadura barringtoniae TaxID=1427535 RepID=A0A939P7V8_9ACTN|nr:FAD binding domain-containing protein [Actinomadura barringtoniae]MBO2447492.1 FAD binding domain-containing protein [Actinomadura barringtoniae]